MSDDTDANQRQRRARLTRAMRVGRRVHMYLGLFLLPFVLIYGVSGFLFNHGQILAPYDIRRLPPETGERIRSVLPPAPALADTVVSRLASRLPDRDWRLVDPAKASYRITMGFRTYAGDVRHHLVFETENGSAEIHSATPKPKPPTPLGDLKKLSLENGLRDTLIQVATSIYESNGQPTGSVDHQWGPQLKFFLESNGQAWHVTYNLGNRNIHAVPAEGVEGRNTFRDFLLGLHLAHTYPIHPNVRTAWAIIVDLTSITMVL